LRIARIVLLSAGGVLAAGARDVGAQRASTSPMRAIVVGGDYGDGLRPTPVEVAHHDRLSIDRQFDSDPSSRKPHWWAPLASALVPGTGQAALRQQRTFAYLAAEGFLAVQWFAARRDGQDGRTEYRRIARDVARAPFGGPLRTAPWEYYEFMERFLESGAFNRGTGGAFVPETDTRTLNGRRWQEARVTFFRDTAMPPAVTSAEYQRALAFYRARAIPDEFRWSWANAQLQQDEFVQRIRRSNGSYRRAAEWGGLLLANHLLSTIDAFIAVRLGRLGDGVFNGGAPPLDLGAAFGAARPVAVQLRLPLAPGR
jgi:hypothetical protein